MVFGAQCSEDDSPEKCPYILSYSSDKNDKNECSSDTSPYFSVMPQNGECIVTLGLASGGVKMTKTNGTLTTCIWTDPTRFQCSGPPSACYTTECFTYSQLGQQTYLKQVDRTASNANGGAIAAGIIITLIVLVIAALTYLHVTDKYKLPCFRPPDEENEKQKLTT
jgi:hypothetical protein